jgi:hypothetical protein
MILNICKLAPQSLLRPEPSGTNLAIRPQVVLAGEHMRILCAERSSSRLVFGFTFVDDVTRWLFPRSWAYRLLFVARKF